MGIVKQFHNLPFKFQFLNGPIGAMFFNNVKSRRQCFMNERKV
jgi:hypothetical protein